MLLMPISGQMRGVGGPFDVDKGARMVYSAFIPTVMFVGVYYIYYMY